jgi:hypothetical protein
MGKHHPMLDYAPPIESEPADRRRMRTALVFSCLVGLVVGQSWRINNSYYIELLLSCVVLLPVAACLIAPRRHVLVSALGVALMTIAPAMQLLLEHPSLPSGYTYGTGLFWAFTACAVVATLFGAAIGGVFAGVHSYRTRKSDRVGRRLHPAATGDLSPPEDVSPSHASAPTPETRTDASP